MPPRDFASRQNPCGGNKLERGREEVWAGHCKLALNCVESTFGCVAINWVYKTHLVNGFLHF